MYYNREYDKRREYDKSREECRKYLYDYYYYYYYYKYCNTFYNISIIFDYHFFN